MEESLKESKKKEKELRKKVIHLIKKSNHPIDHIAWVCDCEVEYVEKIVKETIGI